MWSPTALAILLAATTVIAQNASTSMQIPPLQWINLSRLIKNGSAPIPLRDSSMVYDPAKRALVIFGGESAAGTPVQNTWILEIDTLSWRTPIPPDAQREIPPARSAAVTGADFASNLRSGLLLFGGKGGSGNTPLNDVWYYSFQNEFWAQVAIDGSSPQSRWNAAGGTAPRSVIQNVETYLWAVGGRNATHGLSFDDVWELNVSGTMAAGVNGAKGVWSRVPTAAMSPDGPKTPRSGIAGSVIPPRENTDREGTVVVFGGCEFNGGTAPNATCAQRDGHVLTLPTSNSQTQAPWTQTSNCPAGMYAASLAPNRNQAASAFADQIFLLPGAVDPKTWQYNGGTKPGEIGVLLANSGIWARVVPSGDPQSDPTYPSPKEGAAIYSHTANIAGGTSPWSDIVVFGGKDVATGQLTNELWLLRAYNEIITSSSDLWTGYGNGQLQSGLMASGTGVRVDFLSQCATPIDQPKPTTTSSGPSNPTSSTSPETSQPSLPLFDSSPVHKTLSPISVLLVFIAVLFSRYSSGPATTPSQQDTPFLFFASGAVALAAFALGVAGFAISAVPESRSLTKRAVESQLTATFLGTSHSRAAFVLFIVLYGVVTVYALFLLAFHWLHKGLWRTAPKVEDSDPRNPNMLANGEGLTPPEKPSRASEDDGLMMRTQRRGRARTGSMESQRHGVDSDSDDPRPPSRPLSRSGSSGLLAAVTAIAERKRRQSNGTLGSMTSPPTAFHPPRFEVTNRPRRSSHPSHAYPPPTTHAANGVPNGVANGHVHVPRSLSDISWLARRRSVGTVGELDYAISTGAISPTPNSPNPLMNRSSMVVPPTPSRLTIPPQMPPTHRLLFNILLQVTLLYASVFWLVTFHLADATVGLAVTAVAIAAYYIGLVVLAWNDRPRRSLLVVIISRLRSSPTNPPSDHLPASPHPPSTLLSPPGTHPYFHHAPFRVAHEDEDTTPGISRSRARSADSDPPDGDEDDDERQARIEEEMARRDVSIFTVPKRKLVVRNT